MSWRSSISTWLLVAAVVSSHICSLHILPGFPGVPVKPCSVLSLRA